MRVAIVTEQRLDAAALMAALMHTPNAVVVAKFAGLNEVRQQCDNGEVDIVLIDAAVLDKSSESTSAFSRKVFIESSFQSSADDKLRELSPREQEVIIMLGKGLSNRQISRMLGVTERTTKAHVGSILSKLGLESRLQAGLMASAYSGVTEKPLQ